MNRPYIICHMLTTLDGKISGPALGSPEATALAGHCQKLHRLCRADATIYGKTTVEEVFTKGRRPELPSLPEEPLPREDHIADPGADQYLIAVDPEGELGWTGSVVQARGPGYDGAHIIEILRTDVSDCYLAYLRRLGISYLFGGAAEIRFSEVCAKLQRYFGIEKLLLQGGGLLNGSFAAEDLIDELSLLIAPAADCGSGQPSLFEGMPGLSASPRRFVQRDIQVLEHSGLALQYVRQIEEIRVWPDAPAPAGRAGPLHRECGDGEGDGGPLPGAGLHLF